MKCLDIKGKKFGHLTVLCRVESDRFGKSRWKCICDCGKETISSGSSLVSGKTRSCGCTRSASNSTHGMSKTRLHWIWRGIKDRCYNPNNTHYYLYGKRGIFMCDEWKNDFTEFAKWANSHGYSETLTIDRIDNDNGYCPENCRWVTRPQQCVNKRTNLKFEYNGETKALSEWCKIFGRNYYTVHNRIYHGIPFETAMFETQKLPRGSFSKPNSSKR